MFEGTYSNIHAKPKTRRSLLKTKKGMDALLNEEQAPENNDIISHFIEDLKELLNFDSAADVIQGIHGIEASLNKLHDRFPGNEVPHLSDFYQELSPLLLQKYWELRSNPLTEESTDHLFLESLFIAIEEEIYIWQEKIN